MENKLLINKMKNAAELAWAAYGYFDLIGKKFAHKKEYGNRTNTKITLHDILDSTYVNYETHDSTFFNTENLKGDFSPLQVKRFFEKYDYSSTSPTQNQAFLLLSFKIKNLKNLL